MTPVLTYLAWSAVLLLVHVVIQALSSDLTLGIGYAVGPQDEERVPDSVIARRLERGLMNFIETYPAFVALAAVAAIGGISSGLVVTGAAIWFWARVAYIPAYISGIPLLRSAIWALSLLGLVLMAIGVLS